MVIFPVSCTGADKRDVVCVCQQRQASWQGKGEERLHEYVEQERAEDASLWRAVIVRVEGGVVALESHSCLPVGEEVSYPG